MFKRTKPCQTCPFRTNEDGLRYLGRDRAEGIVQSLNNDESFTCHDDINLPEKDKNHCVGAMLLLERDDNPNQMMRICERLGFYDRTKISGDDEVFDSFEDWIEAQA